MFRMSKDLRHAFEEAYNKLKVPEKGSLFKDYFTVKEVAQHLNLSEYVIRKLIKTNQIKAIKICRNVRIERSELARFKVHQRFINSEAK